MSHDTLAPVPQPAPVTTEAPPFHELPPTGPHEPIQQLLPLHPSTVTQPEPQTTRTKPTHHQGHDHLQHRRQFRHPPHQ